MYLSSYNQVLGLIVLVGIILGAAIPIIGIATSPWRSGGEFLPRELFRLFSLSSIFSGWKTLVYNVTYNVSPGFRVDIDISGGGVELRTWDKDLAKIEVYEVKWFPITHGGSYDIAYNNETNALSITLSGYNIVVYLPKTIVAIKIEVLVGE